MKSIVASNIKRIISEKGYKQGAIGELAGYNVKSFNHMLNGRKLITDIDIPKICRVLSVTPNDLFGIIDQQKRPQFTEGEERV